MLPCTYRDQACSVARTLEIVGERWTLLIVRDALLGVSQFGEFRNRLGVAASVLATRLDRLVSAGVLERVPYQTHPHRYSYQLTAAGRALAPVILSLMAWGDRYLNPDRHPPRTAHHACCDGPVEVQLRCRTCAAMLSTEEIVTRPGSPPPDPPNPTLG